MTNLTLGTYYLGVQLEVIVTIVSELVYFTYFCDVSKKFM